MSVELDIVKQLEKRFDKKLERVRPDVISSGRNGYSIDENGYIIGLNLNRLEISDISFLKDLTNLIELNLNRNKISDISVLKGLTNLTKLWLGENKISDISVLKYLTKLTCLYLWKNKIKDISVLKNLKNLSRLGLNAVKISDISVFKDLTNLTWLDLRNNKISQLPADIVDWEMEIKWECEPVKGIFLEGNPLEEPPVEIVKQGKKAVETYFESLEKSKERPLREVKVLFVGEGGAGKTSLVKRLRGKDFDKTEPETHGININQFEVKHGEHGEGKIKVHFWDFGGQEIMHTTHKFFLSRRSLYVLVVDGRRDDKPEYWLKHIRLVGGDSPILVVINKIDINPAFDVNRRILMEKYENIKGFYRVSCATGEGINDFSKQLIEELGVVELIRIIWPTSWFNVKNKLEKMAENFIGYEEYKAICEKEYITDKESQDTLLDYLNDLGVILHFKDFDLRQTHVLNPKWVTTAVYKIINSKEAAINHGLLKLHLLNEILKKAQKDDYHYPPDKYRYIIELMRKFELCFEVNRETFLLPDLLEVEEPEFDFDYTTALKFLVLYDFLPRSVILRFIVKMHKDIKEGLRWRTGVVLEDKTYRCTAVVKADDDARSIYIHIQGKQRRDYFSVIRKKLEDINGSFEKLVYKERIPLPDNPEITVDYKHLLWLEQEGESTYAPEGAQKKYNVSALLGTINKNVYVREFGRQLSDLRKEFLELSRSELNPKKRGFAFEKFLNRLFGIFDLNPRNSFRNIGEQIDGSFQLGSDTYLVEAKWQSNKTSQRDLLAFNGIVSSKAKWARGLFISIAGFTEECLNAFSIGLPVSVIGMDGRDLEYILEKKNTMALPEAIDLKSRYAAETNKCFAPLLELKERYRHKYLAVGCK